MFDFTDIKALSELPEDEKVERNRRMNVIHSRRKRDRERIELAVLEEHCYGLRDTQDRLKREQNRLGGLLQDAETCISQLEMERGLHGQFTAPTAASQDASQLIMMQALANFEAAGNLESLLRQQELGRLIGQGYLPAHPSLRNQSLLAQAQIQQRALLAAASGGHPMAAPLEQMRLTCSNLQPSFGTNPLSGSFVGHQSLTNDQLAVLQHLLANEQQRQAPESNDNWH